MRFMNVQSPIKKSPCCSSRLCVFAVSVLFASSAYAAAPPPPMVTSIAPSAGPSGGTNTVIFTGTGFTGATVVNFLATPATSFIVVSDTQINAVAPAQAAGAVTLTVTATGSVTTGAIYTYLPPGPPTIASVTPNTGSINGMCTVVITGTNFNNPPVGAGGVTFNGLPATNIVVINGTTLSCETPAVGPGAVPVVVTNGQAPPATLAGGYTYLASNPNVQVNVTVTVNKRADLQWGNGTSIDDAGVDHTLLANRVSAYTWTVKDPSYGTSIATASTYHSNDATNAKTINLSNVSLTFAPETIAAIVSNTTYWNAAPAGPGTDFFTMKAQLGTNAPQPLSSAPANLTLTNNLVRNTDQALVLEFDSPLVASAASIGAVQSIYVTLTASAP